MRPVYLSPGGQAAALGELLRQWGFRVEVHRSREHHIHPCLVIKGSFVRELPGPEYVYAAPDEAGEWWFWTPTAGDPLVMERIAPIISVSLAAREISRRFSPAVVTGSDALVLTAAG